MAAHAQRGQILLEMIIGFMMLMICVILAVHTMSNAKKSLNRFDRAGHWRNDDN